MIKLKSLLQLNESVSISIAGAREEYSSIRTLFDLSNVLTDNIIEPIINKLPAEQKKMLNDRGFNVYNILVPDGTNIMKSSGILNFYISGFLIKDIQQIITLIKERLDILEIEYGSFSEPENSKSINSLVIRIPIINISSNKNEIVPEMNISNRNFRVLFHNILKLLPDDEYVFSLSADDLEKAIYPFIQGTDANQMQKLSPYIIKAYERGKFYDMGLSLDQLSRYIQSLNAIVQWAKEHGYKKIIGA